MMTRTSDSPELSPRPASAKRRRRRLVNGGVMAVVLVLISGCSSVPDALNPAEWYNSTVDFFSGKSAQGQPAEQGQAGVEQKNPGQGQPFPSLSSVPKRPAKFINHGLAPDLEGRKYAAAIARQDEPLPAAQSPVAQAPATQPAPPAVPVIAVQPAPVAVPAPQKLAAVTPAAPQPAAQLAALPANSTSLVNSMSPLDMDPYATVVISSKGVEMNGSAVSMAKKPFAPSLSAQREALPAALPTPNPSMAPAPSLAQAPVSGETRIATILFGDGSTGLNDLDRRILGEVVLLHRQRGGAVLVVGHSSSRTRNMDPVRHAMVNYKISADRANKIAAELVRQGMPAKALQVDARSDSMPIYSEDMPSGEAGNRRTEIYFVN